MPFLRAVARTDIPVLALLIEHSVRALQRETYTPAQIDLALTNLYGVDTLLIDDGTYFAVEARGEIVACGGWSKRATIHGGDRAAGRNDALLNPNTGAAKIRAFFVHPNHARRGLASLLLAHCEHEAAAAGFRRIELSSTLSGVPFYAARGYVPTGREALPLPLGESLPVVRMERPLP